MTGPMPPPLSSPARLHPAPAGPDSPGSGGASGGPPPLPPPLPLPGRIPNPPSPLVVRCLATLPESPDQAESRRAIAALLDRPAASPFVTEFTAAAESESVSLDLVWLAEPRVAIGPCPPMAALAVPGAGSTAMVFVTGGEMPIMGQSDGCARLSIGNEPGWLIENRSDLLRAVANDIAGGTVEACRGVAMLQALVDPEQTAIAGSYIQAGFTRLARLGYYRRPIHARRGENITWPAGIRLVSMNRLADGEAMLARALDRSYIDTLDCPALCGLRPASDVIESHKSVGSFDPALWFILLLGDEPVGCILLSVCDTEGSVELVYLGLGPEVRGKGLGRGLMVHALGVLAGIGRTLACAVDMDNAPALRLYEQQGFRRFAARDAFILPLHRAAK